MEQHLLGKDGHISYIFLLSFHLYVHVLYVEQGSYLGNLLEPGIRQEQGIHQELQDMKELGILERVLGLDKVKDKHLLEEGQILERDELGQELEPDNQEEILQEEQCQATLVLAFQALEPAFLALGNLEHQGEGQNLLEEE